MHAIAQHHVHDPGPLGHHARGGIQPPEGQNAVQVGIVGPDRPAERSHRLVAGFEKQAVEILERIGRVPRRPQQLERLEAPDCRERALPCPEQEEIVPAHSRPVRQQDALLGDRPE